MNVREHAIYFAGAQHADQMYGESPYFVHLSAVDGVLGRVGYPATGILRTAAWLHDTLEDTQLSEEKLIKTFGNAVHDLVWRVTHAPGVNHRERAERTYPKICGNEQATALKLADRIANLERSCETGSRHALMYVQEHEDFREALYRVPQDVRLRVLWGMYEILIYQIKMERAL